MLLLGTLFGFAAILIGKFYALNDYWNPTYVFGENFPFEDFLYGFIFGGISTEILELFIKDKQSKSRSRPRYDLVITFLLVSLVCFLLFVDKLGLNSIIAHIVPPIIVGLYVSYLRRDLAKKALATGLIMTILTFFWQFLILVIYPDAINNHWYLENLTGILLAGVPIEELVFAFALGYGASFVYELIYGIRYVK